MSTIFENPAFNDKLQMGEVNRDEFGEQTPLLDQASGGFDATPQQDVRTPATVEELQVRLNALKGRGNYEDLPVPPSTTIDLEGGDQRLLTKRFFEYMQNEGAKFSSPTTFENRDTFLKASVEESISTGGRTKYRYFVKLVHRGREIKLTTDTGRSRFLKFSSIEKQIRAAGLADAPEVIREVFGITNYRGGGQFDESPTSRAAARMLNALPTQAEAQSMDVSELANRSSDALEELAEEMETNIDTDEVVHFNVTTREIRGLDQVLQTMKGYLENQRAKVLVKEGEIKELEDKKRTRLSQKEQIDLEQLKEQRDTLRKDIYQRETLYAMNTYDRTLGERLRTLFREQGVTIASVVTGFGLAISAIVKGILLATRSPLQL